MRTLFGAYQFPERWADLGPRYADLDKYPDLSLLFFTELDAARAQVVDSDMTQVQIGNFMVRVSAAFSYCGALVARLAGHLNQANQILDETRARKVGAIYADPEPTKRPKSDAALQTILNADADMIALRWGIADLESAKEYAGNTLKALQKDSENWRARYYGAYSDKKQTSGVGPTPEWAGGPGGDADDIPPPLGHRTR